MFALGARPSKLAAAKKWQISAIVRSAAQLVPGAAGLGVELLFVQLPGDTSSWLQLVESSNYCSVPPRRPSWTDSESGIGLRSRISVPGQPGSRPLE